MKLTIGEKEYTFEFTIAASLCSLCVEKTTQLIFGVVDAETDQDFAKMVSSISDIAGTTFALFYGGLLEHHGDEIKSEKDARKLLSEYFKENTNRSECNFYTLFKDLLGQVNEDGFFDLLGLNSMMDSMIESAKEDQTTGEKKPARKTSTTTTKR